LAGQEVAEKDEEFGRLCLKVKETNNIALGIYQSLVSALLVVD
jgi:hypothetical protein